MAEGSVRRGGSQVTFRSAAVVLLTAALVTGLVYLVIATRVAIALTVVSALVAVAMSHAADFFQRRGLGRGLSAALVVAFLTLAVGAVVGVAIPTLAKQSSGLASRAEERLAQLRRTGVYRELDRRFGFDRYVQHLEGGGGAMPGAASSALSAIGGVVGTLAHLFTTYFLAIFMLFFGGRLVARAVAEVEPGRRERVRLVVGEIYRAVGGYLAGITFVCTVNAVLTTTFLAIAGVPWFLPLGIVSGFSSLVPYAGPLVAGAAITCLALLTGGLWLALATAIYFLLYGQLEGQVLAPLVFRQLVHVNPLVTILAILFFAEFAGVIGALVAVPVVAALQTVLGELLAVRRERLGMPPAGPLP